MTTPQSADRAVAVNALQRSMYDLTGQFRRYYAQSAEALSPGLSRGAYLALGKIERFQPVTVSRLAEMLDGDKGLVSRQVSELVRHGLVARAADPADARVKLLSVTEAARERLTATRVSFETLLASGVEGWSLDEIGRLTNLLQALNDGVFNRD